MADDDRTQDDSGDAPHAKFARDMRIYRLNEGWSQSELARRTGYSNSKVGMTEQGRRRSDEVFAQALDKAFELTNHFAELHKRTRWDTIPAHYRDWRTAEDGADEIHTWNPMLVPGLFQTEAYARQIFSDAPGSTSENVEQLVEGRMQRQALLHRDSCPMIVSLIDEGVLRRPLLDPALMREQLARLLEIADHPKVIIQVVPFESRSSSGLVNAYSVALRGSRALMVYSDVAPEGHVINDRAVITRLMIGWSALRGAALPSSLSTKMIKKAMDTTWT